MKKGQKFNEFGPCERCKEEWYVNAYGICAKCYEWIIESGSDPARLKRHLGDLARTENGIIHFTRQIIRSQTSQHPRLTSNLERQSQREVSQEYARLSRLSEIEASKLAKARAASPGANEIFDRSDELFRKIKERPSVLNTIPPDKFEEFMADLLERLGFHDVRLTPRTRDKGRDVLAKLKTSFGELLTIVECKRYALARKVGIGIVERFLFTIRESDRASCGLTATTSFFSADAKARALEYRYQLQLADRDQIIKLVGQVGTWQEDKNSQL